MVFAGVNLIYVAFVIFWLFMIGLTLSLLAETRGKPNDWRPDRPGVGLLTRNPYRVLLLVWLVTFLLFLPLLVSLIPA